MAIIRFIAKDKGNKETRQSFNFTQAMLKNGNPSEPNSVEGLKGFVDHVTALFRTGYNEHVALSFYLTAMSTDDGGMLKAVCEQVAKVLPAAEVTISGTTIEIASAILLKSPSAEAITLGLDSAELTDEEMGQLKGSIVPKNISITFSHKMPVTPEFIDFLKGFKGVGLPSFAACETLGIRSKVLEGLADGAIQVLTIDGQSIGSGEAKILAKFPNLKELTLPSPISPSVSYKRAAAASEGMKEWKKVEKALAKSKTLVEVNPPAIEGGPLEAALKRNAPPVMQQQETTDAVAADEGGQDTTTEEFAASAFVTARPAQASQSSGRSGGDSAHADTAFDLSGVQVTPEQMREAGRILHSMQYLLRDNDEGNVFASGEGSASMTLFSDDT